MESEHAGGQGVGSPAPDPMKQALDRMWIQFLPMMMERAGILQSAGASARAGSLSEGDREAAHSAAHKLAGALGTFGLTEGTTLAREAEALYAGVGETGEQAERLEQLGAQIRHMIESRK